MVQNNGGEKNPKNRTHTTRGSASVYNIIYIYIICTQGGARAAAADSCPPDPARPPRCVWTPTASRESRGLKTLVHLSPVTPNDLIDGRLRIKYYVRYIYIYILLCARDRHDDNNNRAHRIHIYYYILNRIQSTVMYTYSARHISVRCT